MKTIITLLLISGIAFAERAFVLNFMDIPKNAEFSGVAIVMADNYDDLIIKAQTVCKGSHGAYAERMQYLVGDTRCGENTERFVLQCVRYEKRG